MENSKEDSVELQKLFYCHLAALPRRNPLSNRRGQRVAQSRLMEPKVKIFSACKSTMNKPLSMTQKHKSFSAPLSEMDKLLNRSKFAKTEKGATKNTNEMDRLLSRNQILTSKSNSGTAQVVSVSQPSSSNTVTVNSSSLSEMDKLEARSKMIKIRCKPEDNVSVNTSVPHEPNIMTSTSKEVVTDSMKSQVVKRKGVIKLKRKFIPLESNLITACKLSK